MAVLLVVAAAWASPASAQRYTVELKAGAAVGNYTDTGAGLELLPRPSFGALVDVAVSERFTGYLGVTRSSFGCEEGFCATRDHSFTSQGLIAGARFAPGLFWGRAGLAVQWLRVTSDAVAETRGPGVGWDLAAGVEVPVGRGFVIRPGLTYLRHGAATDTSAEHVAVLALEVGVAMRF